MSKPEWSKQKQPDPPNFGQAKMETEKVLQAEVKKRQDKCSRILQEGTRAGYYKKGLVSIVVLSCKRLNSLKRLCDSLGSFMKDIETYVSYETILVDNGSGSELIKYAEDSGFFDNIIAFEKNLGMTGALRKVYPDLRGEFVLFIEDDFIIDNDKPFLDKCVRIFREFPEIGIIRLKNQNNWWKPFRRISPLRSTSSGTEFWTWLPNKGRLPFRGGELNVWAAGSVMFRKVSYLITGDLPEGLNTSRSQKHHQGTLYEEVYGKKYNKTWLAAKIKDCYPFYQPNDNEDCPGWGEG